MYTIDSLTRFATDTSLKVLEKSKEVGENTGKYLRKVGLATLGVATVCQEELDKQVDRFAKKGSKKEKEMALWFEKMWRNNNPENYEENATVLDKMNIPSKDEVDNLNHKVDQLNQKVNAIANEADTTNHYGTPPVDHSQIS